MGLKESLENLEKHFAVSEKDTPWVNGYKQDMSETFAKLREDLSHAEVTFTGNVEDTAYVAANYADRISEEVKTLAKGLSHADKMEGAGVDFLKDVQRFQRELDLYGKNMAKKVPQDIWAESHKRGSVVRAEAVMRDLGEMIDVKAVALGLSGSPVVSPDLRHAAGNYLLDRGELPKGIHREMGADDPKAVSGRIKAFIDKNEERKVLGVSIGVKHHRYAIIDNGVGSGFYKVALSKEHLQAERGDFLGGMRKPGATEFSSTALTPKNELGKGKGLA